MTVNEQAERLLQTARGVYPADIRATVSASAIPEQMCQTGGHEVVVSPAELRRRSNDLSATPAFSDTCAVEVADMIQLDEEAQYILGAFARSIAGMKGRVRPHVIMCMQDQLVELRHDLELQHRRNEINNKPGSVLGFNFTTTSRPAPTSPPMS